MNIIESSGFDFATAEGIKVLTHEVPSLTLLHASLSILFHLMHLDCSLLPACGSL